VIADGVAFWSALRSLLRAAEARSLRMVAELVAPHTKTAGRRAETLSHLLGGEALNEGGASRLVLPLGRMGWFEEDALKLCKLFGWPVQQNATLLSG